MTAPSTASAADLFTQPGGVTAGACTVDVPCDLEYAIETAAVAGDAVFVTGLTYEVTSPIVVPSDVTVRATTLPRPMLRGAAGLAGPTLTVQSNSAVIGLKITSQSAQPALDLNGYGRDLEVTASAGNAARLRGASELSTAVVHTSAASSKGIALTDGLLTGATITHATIIASGSGSTALDLGALTLSVGNPNVSDSIINGAATDINAGGLLASVNVDHSSYRAAAASGVVSGGGNVNAAPSLVNIAGGNFQQQTSAPTVDMGANADGATLDLAGKPRVSDGAPDIGAYELPVPPDATTDVASSVTGTTATIAGVVNPRSTATNYRFVYGTTNPPATQTTLTSAGALGTPANVTTGLSGLKPGTTYFYRVTATSTWGTTQGAVDSFTTLSVPATATTSAVTGTTATGTTLRGTVNPGGESTDVKFEWGADTSYGNEAGATTISGPDNTAVSAALTGLLPGQTYHYRAVATNSHGTVNGADGTFTTPSVAPTVASPASASVTSSGATISGQINPGGATTSWAFEYGTGGSYDNELPGTDLTGATAQGVSEPLTGLLPGKTYDWRIVATNTNGTTIAGGQFTTLVAAPQGTTLAPSGTAVRADGATLSANVVTGGGDSRVRFEYGTTAAYGQTTAWDDVNANDAPVSTGVSVTGLQPTTKYHYRVVVENSAGTATGGDASFTTKPAAADPPQTSESANATASASGSGATGDSNPGGGNSDSEPAGPTQADGLPAPELVPPVGRATNASPASGTIRVRIPGDDEFVELTEGASIPVGSVVDATEGAVTITSAKDLRGTTQSANFTGAEFKVTQRRAAKPITDITLTGGSFSDCAPRIFGKLGDQVGTAAARRKWSRRRLWGNGHGRFRTRGRHGTATVRGTWWLTEDRCDGTLVRVRRGLVEVRDLERRRTVMVPAGKSYLAKSLAAKKRRARKLR